MIKLNKSDWCQEREFLDEDKKNKLKELVAKLCILIEEKEDYSDEDIVLKEEVVLAEPMIMPMPVPIEII